MSKPTPDLPPSMAEQQAVLLDNAAERLRDAAQALSDISGLVPDAPYLDWDKKNPRKLPLGHTQWLLNHIADNLNGRHP